MLPLQAEYDAAKAAFDEDKKKEKTPVKVKERLSDVHSEWRRLVLRCCMSVRRPRSAASCLRMVELRPACVGSSLPARPAQQRTLLSCVPGAPPSARSPPRAAVAV